MSRMKVLSCVLLSAVFTLCFAAFGAAAEYPVKPITVILPHPAGGASDLSFRPLATAAQKYLGQPIIVDNRGGGGGTVGPSLVAVRPPDGYTLGVMTGATVIAWHMHKLNFNPIDGVTPIMTYSGFLLGIVVRSDSPFKNMKEFIDFARKNPGKIQYGSAGVGTTAHMPVEELAMQANVKFTHVPFKGDAGVTPALLGGHIDALSSTSAAWGPLVEAGRFRALAVYTAKRAPRFSNVPTLKELGYDVVTPCPLVIFGPKGLPKPIVEKLHAAFKKAMDDPEFLTVLKKLDMHVFYMGPEEYDKYARQDSERVKQIVHKVGLDK